LAGISPLHFEQSLGALIIAGESLTRSLSFLLRKMLSEVMPELQQLNCETHPHLPFAAMWYTGTSPIDGAIGYAKFRSRSHDAVIRVYDEGPRD
jgi:hypothetical protein